MDSMAKNLATNDKTLSNGEVTVMVVKNRYQDKKQGQPQGHEALQTETDNML